MTSGTRLRHPRRLVREVDAALMARSATLAPSPVDAALRGLGRAANHGRLWWVVAAGTAAVGGRPRRAAVRGLLALGGASVLTNGLLKPLLPRHRPDPDQLSILRRAGSVPRSSSFPSGHAAAAAAFAAGVALESPAAGVVVAPLAAAVAYSRVHVGVHWPSDVGVGVVVGATVAVATRRWWAVRVDEPAHLGPTLAGPAVPGGRGLLVLVNPRSGGTDSEVAERVRAALPEASTVGMDRDREVGELLDEEIGSTAPAALGVCGGDGTVLAVVDAARRHALPLAVFPGGTLNHFARDAGVADVATSVDGLTEGRTTLVDLAEVRSDAGTPRPFVNTASLGGYPDFVRTRERWERRLGKWPAAAAAIVSVLRTADPIAVTLDGARIEVWMLFVGNGRYSPGDRVPMSRLDLRGGLLDVRYLRADLPLSRLRLAAAAATGTLGRSPTYHRHCLPEVTVEVHGPAVSLATDGEVVGAGTGFRFTSRPGALRLYR